ncbi:MAG: RNHCP domain-containing protein [bacterium]
MSKLFQKRVEDFVCEHCGQAVTGSGYTNHCPNCLWSKHVDVNPGDREDECQGMMKPYWIEAVGDKYYVWQKCEKCDHERRNFLGTGDNFAVAAEIMKQEADKFAKSGRGLGTKQKSKK